MITSHRRYKIHVRTYAIAKHLQDNGNDVTLIVTANTRRWGLIMDDWDGVRTVECPDLLWDRLRQGWDPWNAVNKIRYLRTDSRPYNIMYVLETRPATIYPALYYKRIHHLPMVTDWIDWWGRGGIIAELRPGWYRILLGWMETYYEEAYRAQAEGLTVISTALQKRAIDLGVDPDNIFLFPNGSWVRLFSVPDPTACRQTVGLEIDAPVIGFSSLDSHLDMSLVLKAFQRVLARYPQARLLITGTPDKRVTQMAESLGVRENLILTGYLPYDKLPWYLGCADLFVMPFPDKIYNVGRWPSKINGYMSIGRPTVSNPVGDVKKLFKQHQVGLLAEWDPDDFARKMIFLIENPHIARQLGLNARAASVNEYDWRVLTRKLEAFFVEIIARHKFKASRQALHQPQFHAER